MKVQGLLILSSIEATGCLSHFICVPRVNKLQQMKSVFINTDRCQVVYLVTHAVFPIKGFQVS